MNIFCKRLKEARVAAGLSQKRLGILMGIDEFCASTRMNHYEKGTHEPDYGTFKSIARILRLPMAYFYAEDDNLAQLIKEYER